jgi:hypothetical protein
MQHICLLQVWSRAMNMRGCTALLLLLLLPLLLLFHAAATTAGFL